MRKRNTWKSSPGHGMNFNQISIKIVKLPESLIPLHCRDEFDGLSFGDLVGELPSVGDIVDEVGEHSWKLDNDVLLLVLYCLVVISYEHFDK